MQKERKRLREQGLMEKVAFEIGMRDLRETLLTEHNVSSNEV